MAELKTKPTRKSVHEFINSVEHAIRKADAHTLLPIFERLTGDKAVIWGDSIIGFGSYQYENTMGMSTWPLTGYSPRKQNMTIYVMKGFDNYQSFIQKLGKVKHSKSCLYINKLADINLEEFEVFMRKVVDDMRKTYPTS